MDNKSTIIVDLNDGSDCTFKNEKTEHLNISQVEIHTEPPRKIQSRSKVSTLLPREYPFTCPECDKVHINYKLLRRHFRNHEEKKHACSYCGQKFLYLKDKRTHERTHTGERPFVCQVCGKAFNQKCTLDNHLISHNKTVKDEVCDICGRGYYYKKTLAQHKKEKHGKKSDIFLCPKCGKQYFGHTSFTSHTSECGVEHSEKTLYRCGNCGEVFQKIHNLKKHQENCLISQIYQCGVCGETLDTEVLLRQHMLLDHQVSFDNCIQIQVEGPEDSSSQG